MLITRCCIFILIIILKFAPPHPSTLMRGQYLLGFTIYRPYFIRIFYFFNLFSLPQKEEKKKKKRPYKYGRYTVNSMKSFGALRFAPPHPSASYWGLLFIVCILLRIFYFFNVFFFTSKILKFQIF